LFTGLRISATYAVVAAVIAEYVGATDGLGIWMQLSQRSFRTDLVFAAILLTAVLSVGLFGAVVAAERAIIPWYAASRGARQPERTSEAA
jgi:ABC-type nitrate/sulfonate/bicarbonate transport system permease component